MDGESHPQKVALREARERALEELSDGFAGDVIGLDEFENRVDAAYRAGTPEELAALVGDLAKSTEPTVSTSLLPTRSSAPPPRSSHRALAIFGSNERRGAFVVPNGMQATAIFGNVELDLREATLSRDVTHLYVTAIFGNVEVTVPPTLCVESEGTGILGNFEGVHRVPREGATGPVLRIIGTAVLGNVEIRTRPRRDRALLGGRRAVP